MKHYRYDIIGANLNYHIQEHPQEQMKKLGFKVIWDRLAWLLGSKDKICHFRLDDFYPYE